MLNVNARCRKAAGVLFLNTMDRAPSDLTQRLKLTIAYVGTNFKGWQLQAHPHYPEPRTVQGVLEAVVNRVAGRAVRLHGAGRTDSGVHADGQVAHVDIPAAKAGLDWQRAINAQLPPDVKVVRAEAVSSEFHAQYSARSKAYTYSLWLDRAYTPPRLHGFVWNTGPLEITAMERAAGHLLGEHDFLSLQNAGTPLKSTCRTISGLAFTPGRGQDAALLRCRVEADGFLKQMVRNLMGLLVETGRGKLDPDAVPGILEARDRRAAPATAPACGLCLSEVYY